MLSFGRWAPSPGLELHGCDIDSGASVHSFMQLGNHQFAPSCEVGRSSSSFLSQPQPVVYDVNELDLSLRLHCESLYSSKLVQ